MKRILLVDDDREFLSALSEILKKQFQTYEATGVNDALKLLETVPVDAICSDFSMGDGTGLDLLEKIHEKKADIPFLLISGFDDTSIINKVRNYGASFCCKADPDLILQISLFADGEVKGV